ncbi:hypothetical protein L596_009413 [Steinernema carpocapsae]|uniref:Uncharacterized protein n=1 Tax=Steinernema carpocapsae TaxID=34508 RepID=A0A4U5PFS0_STECR|nr:hypothetical protein L596_009413 [Steinernema carpocapsae]
MEWLCYDFINSVAHFVSKKSVEELPRLCDSYWSKVGQTHAEKRVDYNVEFTINQMIHCQLTPTDDIHKCASIWHILNVNNGLNISYVRINELNLRLDTPRKVFTKPSKSQFAHLDTLLNSVSVKKLHLTGSLHSEDELDFLWRRPVECLRVRKTANSKVVEFHLFENDSLRELSLKIRRSCGYDYVSMLVESWEKDERQEIKFNFKPLKDLKDLGFKCRYSEKETCYERVLKGTKKSVLLRCL